MPVMALAEDGERTLEAVYVDGVAGDDSKDGTTGANAVKTMDKALELVSDNGTVLISDSVSLVDVGVVTLDCDNRNITFKRAAGNVHHLFVLRGNTELTLKNVTIDGDGSGTGISVKNGAALTVEDGTVITNLSTHAIHVNSDPGKPVSRVLMRGGEITNVFNTFETGASGTVFVGEDGVFTMEGGVIKENFQINGGGAVHVLAPVSNDTIDRLGKFYMNGGVIEENDGGRRSGGAVENYGYCELNGGIIRSNVARWGGGVSTCGVATTVINGTEITGNTCRGNGAGVYVEGFNPNGNPGGLVVGEATVTVNSGSITNNESQSGSGGGIFGYAGEYPTTIEVNGGTISGNSVAGNGAAIAISGNAAYDYAKLELAGSPTIEGDVFMFDDRFSDIKVDVVKAFSPTNPVVLNDTSWTDFRTVAVYANGLVRDMGHFTTVQPVPPRDVIPDQKDPQSVLSINKLLVEFYSDDAFVGKSYVVPGAVIAAGEVPEVAKEGFALTGWKLGDGTEWNMQSGTVTENPTKLYASWEKSVVPVPDEPSDIPGKPSVPGVSEMPRTGDAPIALFCATLLFVSAAGVLILSVKKRRSNR